MSTSEPWQNLRAKYLAALDHSPPASWHEVWELFLNDNWYQTELRRHARFVLWSTGAPTSWVDDLRHEAMLLLAAKLRKAADLHLDQIGRSEKFPNAVGIISRNACRQALKRLRRIYRTGQGLWEEAEQEEAIRLHRLRELSLALSASINDLPETECLVLRLYLLGYNLREIALQLGLSYWKVYKAFRRGLDRVRRELN